MHISDELVWRSDDTCIPVEYWSYPMFMQGELAGCVVAFVDISERKRVEEELRQTEKLTALGKLSAGLAHELNNPAAAAQRASAQLQEQLAELERLAVRLSRHGLQEAQWASLQALQRSAATEPRDLGRNALDRADREDALALWLEEHGIDNAWEVVPGLVDAGIHEERLTALASDLPHGAFADAVCWLSHSRVTNELVDTIAASTRSIADLVGAVKEYSYMDRAPEQEIDVHSGIESTLRILRHRLTDGPELVRDFDFSLPRLVLRAGELNQVWTNLVDNAIDAAGATGEVRIRTYREEDRLIVEVVDNGPGIPSEIQSRIFDPFFYDERCGTRHRAGAGRGASHSHRALPRPDRVHVPAGRHALQGAPAAP